MRTGAVWVVGCLGFVWGALVLVIVAMEREREGEMQRANEERRNE